LSGTTARDTSCPGFDLVDDGLKTAERASQHNVRVRGYCFRLVADVWLQEKFQR
jgi:hypothetical protein